MMFWCEYSPRFGVDLKEEVIKYIDTYVSCQEADKTSETKDFMKYQTQIHSHTCRKKNRNQCSFGFPKPPMRQTDILDL